MLKQDYVPHVTQVLSKSHSWRWPISPLFSVTASSSCCLKHNRRSEGVVKSEAPNDVAQPSDSIWDGHEMIMYGEHPVIQIKQKIYFRTLKETPHFSYLNLPYCEIHFSENTNSENVIFLILRDIPIWTLESRAWILV